MPPVARLDPRSASAAQSIWHDVSEDEFRRHIVALDRKLGEVPADPKIHSVAVWQKRAAHYDSHHRLLAFPDEHRLADDLAFIAAAKEDPKAVSAAAVEESLNGSGLIIHLAVNDGVLPEVADTFRTICRILSRCASQHLSRQSCTNALFDNVITLCEYRIHGRLESNHWTRPRHQPGREKRPLLQALRRFCLTLKSVRSNASKSVESLRDQLVDLCSTYEAVNRCSKDPSKRLAAIKLAVQKSYEICTSGGTCSIQTTIAAHGLDSGQICKERVIRQVNKIGRYWGLCIDMAEDSRRYSALFKNISLDFLAPYTKAKSKVYAKATPKGFVKCHVHAEIQLLVHLDQRGQSDFVRPRVIGVNKAACYLCNLFFLTRGLYFITKTHGRLHEQWTLPDLKDFSDQQRREYRRIITTMTEVLKTTTKSQSKRKRVEPMQSYVCLPTPPERSPLPSHAGTIISDAALNTFQPLTHNSPTPRAPPIGLATAPQVKSSPIPSRNLSTANIPPAPPDHSVKFPQSRSRTPSPLGPSISTLSTPSICSDSSPKRLQATPIQHYSSVKHPQPQSLTPSPPGSSISTLLAPSADSDSPPKSRCTTPGQPSSQLPSSTESASQTESHLKAINTTHVDDASQAPRNTAELHDPRPSPSTGTIPLNPLQLPLIQTIAATQPLRLATPGLYITVEMDGSVSGEAKILDSGDQTSATVIDVDSLKPGEDMTYVKEEGAPCLNLLLCRRRADRKELGCHLELSWLT